MAEERDDLGRYLHPTLSSGEGREMGDRGRQAQREKKLRKADAAALGEAMVGALLTPDDPRFEAKATLLREFAAVAISGSGTTRIRALEGALHLIGQSPVREPPREGEPCPLCSRTGRELIVTIDRSTMQAVEATMQDIRERRAEADPLEM